MKPHRFCSLYCSSFDLENCALFSSEMQQFLKIIGIIFHFYDFAESFIFISLLQKILYWYISQLSVEISEFLFRWLLSQSGHPVSGALHPDFHSRAQYNKCHPLS